MGEVMVYRYFELSGGMSGLYLEYQLSYSNPVMTLALVY